MAVLWGNVGSWLKEVDWLREMGAGYSEICHPGHLKDWQYKACNCRAGVPSWDRAFLRTELFAVTQKTSSSGMGELLGVLCRLVLLCAFIGLGNLQQYDSTGQASAATNQRHNHNRVARHEARQRTAHTGEAHGTAYRQSQAAAATANTYERGQLDESKEHWTGRNSTMSKTGTVNRIPMLTL